MSFELQKDSPKILGLKTYISTQSMAIPFRTKIFLVSKKRNNDESQKKKNVMKCRRKYICRRSVTPVTRSIESSSNSKDGPWYFSELSRSPFVSW